MPKTKQKYDILSELTQHGWVVFSDTADSTTCTFSIPTSIDKAMREASKYGGVLSAPSTVLVTGVPSSGKSYALFGAAHGNPSKKKVLV